MEVVLVSGWKKLEENHYSIEVGDFLVEANKAVQRVAVFDVKNSPFRIYTFDPEDADLVAKRLVQAAGLARGDYDLDDLFLAENKEEP